MAFKDIAKRIPYPTKTPERYKRLDALDRLRQGTFYDHIKQAFDEEYRGPDYVKLRERRPSIIWNGASMLVDQLSGLLWGDEQMPIVRTFYGEKPSTADREAEVGIQRISEALNLDSVMDNVTISASSGSAAVILRATESGVNIEVVAGKECTPTFDGRDPSRLLSLEQCYPTNGAALAEMGYTIRPEDLEEKFWFKLTIDAQSETRFLPMRQDRFILLGEEINGKVIAWEPDPERTWPHEWPTIPVIWARAPSKGENRVDGDCLYGKILDVLVSIDYGLSQIDRGFRYTADPMLAIRAGEMANGVRPASYDSPTKPETDKGGRVIKSSAHILPIEPGGDAKMLEISGQGLDKSRQMISMLREWGLEIAGGMKSDAATTKGIESGRALEMLYQTLILVVKRWRVSLGNMCYIPLLRLILTGLQNGTIKIEGVDAVPADTTMRLVWPTWMTPSGPDLLATANAWQTLAGGSAREPVPILPRSTVTRMAGANLGMTDVLTLVEEIEEQNDEDFADEQEAADADAAREKQIQTAGEDTGEPVKPPKKPRKKAPKVSG